MFDLRRMRVRATIPHAHRKAVKCLSIDVGRRVVASGSNDGSVKVHPAHRPVVLPVWLPVVAPDVLACMAAMCG